MPASPRLVPTRFGALRARVIDVAGVEVWLLSRHAAGHKVPPHAVPYRAMAEGLRRVGVKACYATAAVGSLVPEWTPGTLVACSDLLDFTGRRLTLHDRAVVHTDFTDPFGPEPRAALLWAAAKLGESIQDKGTYLGLDGPRYETPQEIRTWRQLGAEVVGMTASTEAILMREAGVPYSCLAIVTNLGTGISEVPVDHSAVVDVMSDVGPRVLNLLREATTYLAR